MPNEKKSVRAFAFAANPIGELPEEFWRVAKAMRNLWNQLVDMREAKFKELEGITDKATRDQGWQAFNESVTALLRSPEIKSQLNWECLEVIQKRFETSCQQVAKAIREWKREGDKSKPCPTLRKQFGLQKVLIRHRYTGGGKPLQRVFQNPSRSKTFACSLPGEAAFADNSADSKKARMKRGTFLVGDAEFPFFINLHREMPADAIVKTLSWSGKYQRGLGWRWQLIITTESTPQPRHQTASDLIAGLDVGWRKLDDDTLRVGVLYDTSGNAYEIQLPLGVNKDLDNSIVTLQNLQKDMDDRKDTIKALLIEHGFNAARVQKMGQRGISKALRELKEDGGDAGLIGKLEEWQKSNDFLLGRCNALRGHFEKRRKWLYEHIAHALCQTYKVIVIEDDIKLKKLVKKKKKSEMTEEDRAAQYPIDAAKPYMRAASLYLFRQTLKQIAAKYDTEIIPGVTPYSTLYCHEHDSFAEGSAKLMLECPRGHKFDQDVNAARNLLSCVAELPRTRGANKIEWLRRLPEFWRVIKVVGQQ